jgi:hypothetical protein
MTERAAHLPDLAKPSRVFARDHSSQQIVMACEAFGARVNDQIVTKGQWMEQDRPELGDVNNDERVSLVFGRVFRPSTVARACRI